MLYDVKLPMIDEYVPSPSSLIDAFLERSLLFEYAAQTSTFAFDAFEIFYGKV